MFSKKEIKNRINIKANRRLVHEFNHSISFTSPAIVSLYGLHKEDWTLYPALFVKCNKSMTSVFKSGCHKSAFYYIISKNQRQIIKSDSVSRSQLLTLLCFYFQMSIFLFSQLGGLGKIKPNLVVLGFKNDWATTNSQEVEDYVGIIQ